MDVVCVCLCAHVNHTQTLPFFSSKHALNANVGTAEKQPDGGFSKWILQEFRLGISAVHLPRSVNCRRRVATAASAATLQLAAVVYESPHVRQD